MLSCEINYQIYFGPFMKAFIPSQLRIVQNNERETKPKKVFGVLSSKHAKEHFFVDGGKQLLPLYNKKRGRV